MNWNPDHVTAVEVKWIHGMTEVHLDIAGVQFREGYVAVIMKDGSAYIYPYEALDRLKTLPVLDTSAEARDAAVTRYRQHFAGS